MRQIDEEGNEVIPTVDDFEFTDQQNRSYRMKRPGNEILVMNYFFTSCPTICPRMTDNLVSVFDAYENEQDVNLISLTVDPKRDNPQRLRQFMESHSIPKDSNWYFLTGEKKKLYDFARHELYLSALDSEVEIDDDFIHSEKVVLVDKEGYIRGYYSGTVPEDMNRLVLDIKRLR